MSLKSNVVRVSDEELAIVHAFREKHKALQQECEQKGIPIESVNQYWFKSKHFSIQARPSTFDFVKAKEALLKEMKAFSPRYPTIKRSKVKGEHILVVDPADPHFGKYASALETGDSYNMKKAAQRFEEGVEGIIQKVQHYKFDKVVFVGGNDVNHVDTPHNTTTSGTRQDVDGLWFEHYRAAKAATIKAVDRLLPIADVHFVHCPSNHDYTTGFFLADSLASWYRLNKNISFDISPAHRKYFHYGVSLVGLTHGDGAKEADLPDLMKTEARQAWAKSKYGFWYVHHKHHKDKQARKGAQKIQLEKDKIGVAILHTGLQLDPEEHCHVEYIRSQSGTDSWHHRNGYQHSMKAMEAFVHHLHYGQMDRITHLF